MWSLVTSFGTCEALANSIAIEANDSIHTLPTKGALSTNELRIIQYLATALLGRSHNYAMQVDAIDDLDVRKEPSHEACCGLVSNLVFVLVWQNFWDFLA